MIVNIRNGEDLRINYWLIRNLPANADLAELKRAIREYTHRESDRRIIKEYGIDGYVCLIELPDDLKDEREADDYFRDAEYIDKYWSYYDCTGRPFTSWYKLFKRNGRWMAYHAVNFDV